MMREDEATLSDDTIKEMLASHPGLMQTIRAEADEAVLSARKIFNVSQEWIAWKVATMMADAKVAMQRVAGDNDRSEAVLLRHYKACVQAFRGLEERHRKAGTLFEWNRIQGEMLREMQQDQLRRQQEAMPKAPPPPPFDSRAFITGLADRGIVLRSHRAGGLEATPSDKLTDPDREAIKGNLPAIKEAVAALTETF